MENNRFDDLKVLIAEDDRASKILLREIFKYYTSTILTAESGEEAVDVCRQNPDVGLILMDIRMPGMNGYDASREIRNFNKDVVIIAQSAHMLSDNDNDLKISGCDGFITKPIRKAVISGLLEKYFCKRPG